MYQEKAERLLAAQQASSYPIAKVESRPMVRSSTLNTAATNFDLWQLSKKYSKGSRFELGTEGAASSSDSISGLHMGDKVFRGFILGDPSSIQAFPAAVRNGEEQVSRLLFDTFPLLCIPSCSLGVGNHLTADELSDTIEHFMLENESIGFMTVFVDNGSWVDHGRDVQDVLKSPGLKDRACSFDSQLVVEETDCIEARFTSLGVAFHELRESSDVRRTVDWNGLPTGCLLARLQAYALSKIEERASVSGNSHFLPFEFIREVVFAAATQAWRMTKFSFQDEAWGANRDGSRAYSAYMHNLSTTTSQPEPGDDQEVDPAKLDETREALHNAVHGQHLAGFTGLRRAGLVPFRNNQDANLTQFNTQRFCRHLNPPQTSSEEDFPKYGGITETFGIVSTHGTTTPFHNEDAALSAVNLLYMGHSKLWHITHGVIGDVEEQLSRIACTGYSPREIQLRRAGFVPVFEKDLKLTSVLQQPGVLVVTGPGLRHHQTISTGFSVAEAANSVFGMSRPGNAEEVIASWHIIRDALEVSNTPKHEDEYESARAKSILENFQALLEDLRLEERLLPPVDI